ncbi:MAG TPA: hypothetical protein VG889_20635 [Rhizomicrobium sp.]|nr:hypothetical protein [Rhizomicrobium sp.]
MFESMFSGLPRGASADPNYDPKNALQSGVYKRVLALWAPDGKPNEQIANLATTFGVLAQLKHNYRAFCDAPQQGPLAASVKTCACVFEAAYASTDVYFYESIAELVPDGFKRVTDKTKLAALGIKDKVRLIDDASGRYSALYAAGDIGAKGTRYILANRGTDDGFFAGFDFSLDAKASMAQNWGDASPQYVGAVAAAKTVAQAADASGGSVIFTGHSLGGGLATAQALATKKRAYVFNASGVNAATVGGSLDGADKLVTAYVYRGNWLDGWQGLGFAAKPCGKIVDIEHIHTAVGAPYNNPSDWHLLNFVIPGLFGMLQRNALSI